MIRLNSFKLLFTLGITAALAGCSSSDKDGAQTGDSTVNTTTTTTSSSVSNDPASTAAGVEFKDFDWSAVPESTNPIGEFPFVMPPSGFMIVDKGASNESKTGYSEIKDPYMLIIYNGQTFYKAEGKVAKIKFRMKDREIDWNQYAFDKAIDKYMAVIGAKQVGTLKLINTQIEGLNKDDDMTIYNHIAGDPYNEPIRMWALNHVKGKVLFQVYSNSAEGEMSAVQLSSVGQ